MDIGNAIRELKLGKNVARKKWGKQKELYLINPGDKTLVKTDKGVSYLSSKTKSIGIVDSYGVHSYIWSATSEDMLAEDWEVL